MRWLGLIVMVAGCAQVWGFNDTHCRADLTECDGVCLDTLSDHDNCGSCGNQCSGTYVCGNGMCGAFCPVDQVECGGSCIDPLFDAANCNGCGMACGGNNVCVFGECQPPCDANQLMASIVDPWGISWDGLERTPAMLDAAQVTCKAFGARLPTATELFRVAANQSGAVGMSFQTNYLWSLAPDTKLNQATVRLSDGDYSSVAATTLTPYRCVCPAALPKTFTGNHCNGDPGNACFEVQGYNIDTKNRPALRKSAAVYECIADRAHLVDAPLLATAIRAGLPGPNVPVMTADQAAYLNTTMLSWNGVELTWEPAGNISSVDNRNPAPFRCAAPKVAQSPNANAITNVFHPVSSRYTGETADNAVTAWAAAHDACFARGGHIPRSAELAELIEQGLPNGTDTYLWSSDQCGFNGTQFLSATHKWLGLDTRYSYEYTGSPAQTLTWDYKTGSQGYRCIWYPLDPTYVAPTNCMGGCFEVTLPGSSVAKMWFDSEDRPGATPGAAVGECLAAGGRLASERDLTEAIRVGLPNGTAAMAPPWVWTSDFGQGNLMVVRWTDVEMAFTDQYGTYMTWFGPGNSYRYRCMWTNEYR